MNTFPTHRHPPVINPVMHAELPVGAFVAAALVLIPLPWHWRARNIATLSIIAWLLVSNLIFAINSIIWAGNVLDVAPVWCDISTKIQIGANMALPACCLSICIHLERIASVRQVRSSHSDKMRRMIFDAVLCWGLPIIYMALHYIVQGHRFDIIENFGCRPTIYVSIPAVFLIWVPPMITAMATCGFAAVALVHFFRRRMTFARHLQNSNSGLTTSRYFRLMSMAIVQMTWGLLVTSLNMWFTCQHGLRPWISWENVHTGFSQIAYFPTAILPQSTLAWTYALWWVVPISAALFFVFFSFGEDAMKEYRKCFTCLCRPLLRRPTAEGPLDENKSSFARRGASHKHPLFLDCSTISPSFSTHTNFEFSEKGDVKSSRNPASRDSPTSDEFTETSFECFYGEPSALGPPPPFYSTHPRDAASRLSEDIV